MTRRRAPLLFQSGTMTRGRARRFLIKEWEHWEAPLLIKRIGAGSGRALETRGMFIKSPALASRNDQFCDTGMVRMTSARRPPPSDSRVMEYISPTSEDSQSPTLAGKNAAAAPFAFMLLNPLS